MAIFQLRTFSDLVSAIREELQVSVSDTVAINRIKRDVNIVYNEVVAEGRWWWLQGHTTLQLDAYISAGSVSVLQNSSAITFTVPPTSSKKGHYFAAEGYNEIYFIESHVAGSSTAKLGANFTGATNPTASYRLWKDRLPLPADCKETTLIWHDHFRDSLQNVGLQEFRRIVAQSPRSEGVPTYYSTGDYVDPVVYSTIPGLAAVASRSSVGALKTLVFSSTLPLDIVNRVAAGEPVRWFVSNAGDPSYNGEIVISSVSTTTVTNDTICYSGGNELTEANINDSTISVQNVRHESDYTRYRELRLFPSLNNTRVTLHIDYVKDTTPLQDDTDEPVVPIEDRIILLYGALHRAWSRHRNPAEATRNYELYQDKLKKMSGKLQDSFDKPKLAPSKLYMGAKRNATRTRQTGASDNLFGSGGGSGAVVTGLANTVAVFDAKGQIGGSGTIDTTELSYLDGVTSNIQAQFTAITTLANGKIIIGNSSNQITPVTPAGDVTIATDGTTAVVAQAITNAKVSNSAGIARNKLASGTGYRILVNDIAGAMSENASLTANRAITSDANGQLTSLTVTDSSMGFLQDAEALTTVNLPDNTAVAAVASSWALANFNSVFLRYTISRGTNFESGIINLITDGTSAAIAQGAIASLGSLGVTFSTDVSGGNLRLKYTTTSSGTGASLKYKLLKWLA